MTAISDNFTFKSNDGNWIVKKHLFINITNAIPDEVLLVSTITVEESKSYNLCYRDLNDVTIPFTYSDTATMEQFLP